MYKLGLPDEQSTQQASVPDTTQPATDRGEDEDEAYRYAMQQDMQQLQNELQEAQSAVSASNSQLKTTEAEIENLRRECQSLLAVQATRATEIKELRTRNIELEQLLANNEQRFAQRNQDIILSREKETTLRTENATLRAQLDFSDTLHKNALQENESLSSQCAQLASLIKSMTTHTAGNSQAEGIDFLKTQIEAQDRELQDLRLKLENAQQSIGDSQGLEQDHWKNKYAEVHQELESLTAKQLELQKELSAAKEQRIGLETKLALLEKKEEEDKQEEQQDVTFETRYTELAAANMEVDKLRIQITDYQDQLDKQRQAAAELEKEHDAFTADMQTKLAKVHQDLSDRDSMIKAAQTATDDIQRLKLERVEAEQQWNAAKSALDAEKDGLQQRVKEYEEEAARLRQQIETQTELINECKEKLDQEINSHSGDAEKIKSLQEESARLNEEYASAKAELSTLQTQLQTSEESWTKQKEQWEAAENRMKAELENSNKRFAELIDNLPSNAPADVSSKSDEQLKEMAIQLGQKNEILQQQYKVAVLQADKLRNDLGFSQKQIASLQAQIKSIQSQNEEMEKKYAVAQQEAKNEAVVYKENNAQLRASISDLRTRLATSEKEASESKDAIQPLSNKVFTLESKLKAQTETIASLEKSKQEWSTRTAQIMSKYNKLDPAEVESVKQERDALKAQLEKIDTTKTDSDTKIKEIEEQKSTIEKELEDLKQRVSYTAIGEGMRLKEGRYRCPNSRTQLRSSRNGGSRRRKSYKRRQRLKVEQHQTAQAIM
ncbi:hypothetical protein BJV82DRAFT_71140 [Fennellomyces sp. T-0311]|nr:hypothetical protein BJV82DRAFT_71140 [Fennellomyces sp. T-0311]